MSVMTIDAHVHLGTFPSLAELGHLLRRSEDVVAFHSRHPELFMAARNEDPVDNADDLVAVLDQKGITAAVVQARPGLVPNDLVAVACLRYPERLVGLGRIGHEQLVQGYTDDTASARARACDEIARGVETLGMKGVGEVFARAFTTAIHPEEIADELAPIMEVVQRYQLPIQFPTAWSQFPGGLYWGDPLWVDEVAARFPAVPIVLTKMGRGIERYFDACMAVALRNENVYFDTVGTTTAHLAAAVEAIGSRRVMFGTDWSATWRWVVEPADLFTQRLRVVEGAGLSENDKVNVLGRVACHLFGLVPQETQGVKASG